MTTDIFIRSYRGDFKWLEHSLQSIWSRGSGFSKVHIVVPAQDIQLLTCAKNEVVHLTSTHGDDYMGQQVTKLEADQYSHADYILHVDSDCIFTKKFSPDNFFCDGKPIILREEHVLSPWPRCAERALGWYEDAEYMRRLPIIYPRWLYKEFRVWMEMRHGMRVNEWVMAQPNREFSEFNTLGQWAYKFHKDKFAWKHPSEVEPVCKQFWSWSGFEKDQEEVKNILAQEDPSV